MSAAVTLRAEQSADFYTKDFLVWDRTKPLQQYAVGIDDLGKQFVVVTGGAVPEGTVIVNVYRSQDTFSNPNKPLLLAAIPGAGVAQVYPDNQSDAELGPEATILDAVPVFRCMCAHDGCLVVANTPAEPGVLYKSLPAQVGTLPSINRCYPDAACSEITGVESAFGSLYAFTRDRIYEVADTGQGLVSRQVAMVGCVGPGTLTTTPIGLVWLGKSAIYLWGGTEAPQDVSDAERPRIQQLDPARSRYAVACWDADTQEWLCAVTFSGSLKNTAMLAFSRQGFRRYMLNMPVYNLCFTRDFRSYVLLGGRGTGQLDGVFVLDAQTQAYESTNRAVLFQSRWLLFDVDAQQQFNVDSVRVGFLDSSTEHLTMKVYKNGDGSKVAVDDIKMIPCRVESTKLGDVVVAQTPLHDSRIEWRKGDMALKGVRSFMFVIEGSDPHMKLSIASFMFDVRGADPDLVRTKKGSA